MHTFKRFTFLFAALALLLSSCTLPWLPAPPATPTPRLSPTTRPASSVELHVLPDDGQRWLISHIEAAKQRVMMKMYLLTDTRIVEALKRAKRNGADVRAMIEADPFGSKNSANQAFASLRKAGISTKPTNPTFRLTHEKSFVIDDAAIILTANMTRSSFSRNREFAVVHRDPNDVAEIVAAFNADWERTRFTPHSPALVWSPINSRDRINALIESAQRSLVVYAASALDNQQIGLMAQAAQRGVDVRLLISPSRADNDGEDVNAEDLDKLQRGGVKVRLLKSQFVHAKAFVVDESTAFVGSVNITTASLDFNRELGLIFNDHEAIQRILRTFDKDWNKAVER